MKVLKILLPILILASCSPEKRIARILKKHPELVKSDTVWHRDTIYTKSVEKDTTFYFNQPDTVYMNEGKMHVKYYFNKDSTVYLQGKCDADTVIKYYPVQVNSVSVKDGKWYDEAIKYVWFLVFLLILYILYRIFVKH